jgi:cation diffusion facilitator CzcD-associated flavoprotein CzcO
MRDGARIAIVGAGPSGLTAAKHALEAGFDATVFVADGALGGQRNSTAAHSRRVAGDADQHEPGDDRVLGRGRSRTSTFSAGSISPTRPSRHRSASTTPCSPAST